MSGCDRGFDVILSEFVAGRGKIKEPEPFCDELSIPLQSILVEQRMQVAGCVNSAWQARRMKTHESGQSMGSGRCPVRMFKEHRGESHGFAAKLDTDSRMRLQPLCRRTSFYFLFDGRG